MSLDDPFYITGRVDLSLARTFRSQVGIFCFFVCHARLNCQFVITTNVTSCDYIIFNK